MKATNQAKIFPLYFILLAVLPVSCASMLHLAVSYKLPVAADSLKGKHIRLVLEDPGNDLTVIGPGARQAFRNISETYSLFLSLGTDTGTKVGVYDRQSLFMEVFKQRLEQEGLEVSTSGREAMNELRIVLLDFSLDLVERTWKARLGYECRLSREGRILAKRRVSSEAERLKIFRQREADTLVSELVSDAVNRLDVAGMFQEAGLLKE